MGTDVAWQFASQVRVLANLVQTSRRKFQIASVLLGSLIPALLAAPADARAASPLSARRAHEHVQIQKRGSWNLKVVTYGFSGDIRCWLRRRDGKAAYAQNAVGFRFGRDADTLDAWIRTDNDPAVRWRDMLPELAAQRTSIGGKNMASPTDGIVWVPAKRLLDAGTVAIQLRPHKRVKIFELSGLADLLKAGHDLGCTPDARFAF